MSATEIIITSEDLSRLQAQINQVKDMAQRKHLQQKLDALKKSAVPVARGPRINDSGLRN
jgi:hypothetical protein